MAEENAVVPRADQHYAVARTAPYSRGAPCPPPINVPNLNVPIRVNGAPAAIELKASLSDVDRTLVTAQELEIISRISPTLVAQVNKNWQYECRRGAQRILDFLYLGANTAIRDLDFLEQQGITMIVVARDSRMMTWNKRSCEMAETKLGIKTMHLDVDSSYKLISGFPTAVRAINEHIASLPGGDGTRHGKVLVTCETGNDRSAAIVAAYIMAVFGCESTLAIYFINIQRFCCAFDEELKWMLTNWQDLTRARATVARGQLRDASPPRPKPKRGFADTMDEDPSDEHWDTMGDEHRFEGREQFVPFRDMIDDGLVP